jgi:hypothetical protein
MLFITSGFKKSGIAYYKQRGFLPKSFASLSSPRKGGRQVRSGISFMKDLCVPLTSLKGVGKTYADKMESFDGTRSVSELKGGGGESSMHTFNSLIIHELRHILTHTYTNNRLLQHQQVAQFLLHLPHEVVNSNERYSLQEAELIANRWEVESSQPSSSSTSSPSSSSSSSSSSSAIPEKSRRTSVRSFTFDLRIGQVIEPATPRAPKVVN